MSPKLIEPLAFAGNGTVFRQLRRRNGVVFGLAVALIAIITAVALIWFPPVPAVSGPLPQQAYLWQRQWNANVRAAVTAAAPFAELCVSYAEIGDGKGAMLTVQRTSGIDWALLARARQPVGFAIRVHEFAGNVNVAREPFPTLRTLVDELSRAADAAGLHPAEIQVDFDCPTSRLSGFATWLQELRHSFPRQTFRFTALPAWLHSRDFAVLARAAGGYILQLHWLEKPGTDGRPPTTLCDPAQARSAVERAARLGVPFRVALPTYGYRLILDPHGKLLAAVAEDSSFAAALPPPGGASQTLMADPAAMADLVAGWQARRPSALQGLIWYRLPVVGDRLNWEPSTLRAVMTGRHPQPKLALQFSSASARGPCELRLRNDGDGDAPLPGSITVHCPSTPVAADAVGGFELDQSSSSSAQELIFSPRVTPGATERTVPAGKSILFGWVRLETELAADQLSGTLASAGTSFTQSH